MCGLHYLRILQTILIRKVSSFALCTVQTVYMYASIHKLIFLLAQLHRFCDIRHIWYKVWRHCVICKFLTFVQK